MNKCLSEEISLISHNKKIISQFSLLISSLFKVLIKEIEKAMFFFTKALASMEEATTPSLFINANILTTDLLIPLNLSASILTGSRKSILPYKYLSLIPIIGPITRQNTSSFIILSKPIYLTLS